MKAFSNIIILGTKTQGSSTRKVGTVWSNIIALIMFAISVILFVLYYLWYGWNFITYLIPFASLVPLVTLVMNKYGYTTFGRIWIGVYVPILVTCTSIYSKQLYYTDQQDLDYFTFRYLILAACVFPPILFTLKEKTLLWSTSILSFALLILFDWLHELFGVPFPHIDLSAPLYEFTNIVVAITYMILFGAVIFVKSLYEKNELVNQKLIQRLNIANVELKQKNEEIEEQAMELLSQSEALSQNQKKLEKAYKEIDSQKRQLFYENKVLESELVLRNQELTDTNHELIRHNNELRQFSYTISHNLRGPVASLLGLVNLVNAKKLDGGNTEIINHIKRSVERFDTVIRDLSKIIDIRNDIFKVRQRIRLKDEVDQVKQSLAREIESLHVSIDGNYAEGLLYAVQPMVGSILYNLISNAIKYRSPARSVKIKINFSTEEEHYRIEVSDNGLGIDLKQYGSNIFSLYKRFHQHTEGRGLGLYLVKLQSEALGGDVSVESEINKYTTFIVRIRIPDNIQEQTLLNDERAKIFYDAEINSTGVVWKSPITSNDYRRIYKKGIEFLEAYNTPNWLTDLRNQGTVELEDQRWLFTKVLPPAHQQGLRRVACIVPNQIESESVKNYIEHVKVELGTLGIQLMFFNETSEARDWIRQENEKSIHRKS